MTEQHINTESSPARIIQITDTHIGAERSFLFSDVPTLVSLEQVIDRIYHRESPDLVLVTGDLVHDPVTTAYALLLEQLQRLKSPVFCLPGNHDDPVIMEQVLNSGNVSTDKAVRVNDWRVLMLNSHVPGTHAGEIDDSELEWLEEQLQSNTFPVLIALHHPPVEIHSAWMDTMRLRNPGDLFSVLDRFPSIRAVIWGHIHQEFDTLHGATRLLACPSTCVQFRPKSLVYQEDSLPPGYRVIEMGENGQFDTQVIRVTG